jgi:flagellin
VVDEDVARPASDAALATTDGLSTDVIMNGAEYTTINDLDDADEIADLANGTASGTFTANGTGVLTGAGDVKKTVGQLRYTASEGMYTTDAAGNPQTNLLTTTVQNVQAKINTARVQAGSQYAALESAVNYTTDLTAQYELGYNTVNDVNFSMETAHLAKNQILQQAATAMLAQANQGQQGLLQLIS